MRRVNHLEIIAQPAFMDGKTVTCPHCQGAANVREDGSAYCVAEGFSLAPESSDGELFAMRRAFDEEKGIDLTHRLHRVPTMVRAAGFDADGRFHPELSDCLERLAFGLMHRGAFNRVYA